MKLIAESIKNTKSIVEDLSDGSKQCYIEGIFLQSDIVNRNNRIYPEPVMDEEVAEYIREYVDTNRAYGELGHPENPSINLDRVSHMIVALEKNGTNWVGKAKVVNTPMGKIVAGLIQGGASLGVSSRALGSSIEKDGVEIIQPDFHLITAADIVADPSAPDAFVQGIMESKEWIIVDGKYVEQAVSQARQRIKKTPSKRLAEQKIREFKNFLSLIK